MLEKEITSVVQIDEKELAEYIAHKMKSEEFVDLIMYLSCNDNEDDFMNMMNNIEVGAFSQYSIDLLEKMFKCAKENDLKWRRLR